MKNVTQSINFSIIGGWESMLIGFQKTRGNKKSTTKTSNIICTNIQDVTEKSAFILTDNRTHLRQQFF
jgi:hypothetical protein